MDYLRTEKRKIEGRYSMYKYFEACMLQITEIGNLNMNGCRIGHIRERGECI